MSKAQDNLDSQKFRLTFPEDEAKHWWLSILLDAYAVLDKGIDKAIKKAQRPLACGPNCGACCKTHSDIPVYPLELVGIYWYVIEKLTANPLRHRLLTELLNYRQGKHCPFLIDSLCAIHPMRPASCRQFNVFGKPCAEGEDPYYSRQSDVLKPLKEYTDRAFYIMMPFYNITDERQKKKALSSGLLHSYAKILQRLNWRELGSRMLAHDSSKF